MRLVWKNDKIMSFLQIYNDRLEVVKAPLPILPHSTEILFQTTCEKYVVKTDPSVRSPSLWHTHYSYENTFHYPLVRGYEKFLAKWKKQIWVKEHRVTQDVTHTEWHTTEWRNMMWHILSDRGCETYWVTQDEVTHTEWQKMWNEVKRYKTKRELTQFPFGHSSTDYKPLIPSALSN